MKVITKNRGADETQRMLQVNTGQKDFYDLRMENIHAGDFASRVWRKAREQMREFRSSLQIDALIRQREWQWLSDISGKRVLDLGCYEGNSLTLDIASRCAYYLGIDLSSKAVSELNKKLAALNLHHAQARAIDFLASDFPDEPFDLIYAHGVVHHFQHFQPFLQLLRKRLTRNGRVITFDPMQTSLPIWLSRQLYRPFQIDAGWEWPLSRQRFREIEQYFHIEAIQGILGYAKWAIPLTMLPCGRNLGLRIGARLHEWDKEAAVRQGDGLWRCMSAALCLRRREDRI